MVSGFLVRHSREFNKLGGYAKDCQTYCDSWNSITRNVKEETITMLFVMFNSCFEGTLSPVSIPTRILNDPNEQFQFALFRSLLLSGRCCSCAAYPRLQLIKLICDLRGQQIIWSRAKSFNLLFAYLRFHHYSIIIRRWWVRPTSWFLNYYLLFQAPHCSVTGSTQMGRQKHTL